MLAGTDKVTIDRHAAPGSSDGAALAGAAAVGGEDLEHEPAQDRGREAGIEGEAVAQGERKRQDPLAYGDLGEDPVDEVGGGIGHAATAAGGAEPAPLAREGDEAIVPAGIAVDAQESMGEDAALEDGAELSFDEARQRAGALAGQEGLENGLLGPVAFVAGARCSWPAMAVRRDMRRTQCDASARAARNAPATRGSSSFR